MTFWGDCSIVDLTCKYSFRLDLNKVAVTRQNGFEAVRRPKDGRDEVETSRY
jgi:hypothetical protein